MNASQSIDAQIENTGDWRGKLMQLLRELIHEADSNITEEWKWDTGVYVMNGMVCAVSPFKDHVKMNFFKGAQLEQFKRAFNNGLDSKQHRAIDFSEGDVVDAALIKKILQAAVTLNSKSRK